MSSEPPRPTSYAPHPTPSRPSRTRETSTSSTHLPRQKSSNVLLQTPARTSTSAGNASTGGGASVISASFSPAYHTSIRSRHSLYGIEDRIVLDLGSRIWKLGFSGEPRPRVCLDVMNLHEEEDTTEEEGHNLLWALEGYQVDETRAQIRYERLEKGLRKVWYTHLMTDPKQRKIIISENPLLSTPVKRMIARVLFGNLQVPSITFASAPVLALLATGNVTGLVVDCGHLETTVLPVFASRPLFPSLLSTPRASSVINARLKALLLEFGSYTPPPSSLNSSTPPTVGKVPESVLSEGVVEEVKNRCCFVASHAREEEEEGGGVEMDLEEDKGPEWPMLKKMERRFAKQTKATSISWRLPLTARMGGKTVPGTSVGQGWLLIPGWVRERAAEVVFESGDGGEDERGLQEIVLEALLRLPIDLRRLLAASILCTGGTAMLPGFIPRLRDEIDKVLRHSQTIPLMSKPTTSVKDASTRQAYRARLNSLRTTPRYASLTPLRNHISILNDPSITLMRKENEDDDDDDDSEPRVLGPRSGSAPAWSASLLNWIGGSLAGCLKLGGVEEVKREGWEEREKERGKERGGNMGQQMGEDEEEEERIGRGLAPLGPTLGMGLMVSREDELEGLPRVSRWVGLEA
ncbi:BQ2448_3371 [Microbotryum intermedium]|uniref:BQ2448_3371 protein n=1 Tax=Microbotryum intermedium TaxID=269621 RepID=A0A238FCV7_9BASI|nr:BQ2448_3371 [Microbotryum intermedium]